MASKPNVAIALTPPLPRNCGFGTESLGFGRGILAPGSKTGLNLAGGLRNLVKSILCQQCAEASMGSPVGKLEPGPGELRENEGTNSPDLR
jgi:hypothetical protein